MLFIFGKYCSQPQYFEINQSAVQEQQTGLQNNQNKQKQTFEIHLDTLQVSWTMFNNEYQMVDQILQLINDILNILELELQIDQDNTQVLHRPKLYIQVLGRLFPFLQYNLIQIDRKNDSPTDKLESIVRLLERDILKRDISHIRGKDIAKGDMSHVYNLVVVLYELTKRHIGQSDGEQQEDQENGEGAQDAAEQQHEQNSEGRANNYDYFMDKQNKGQEEQQQQKDYQQEEEESSSPQENKRKADELRRYENVIQNNQLIESQAEKLKRQQNRGHLQQEDHSENYQDVLQRKLIDAQNINSASSRDIATNKKLTSPSNMNKQTMKSAQSQKATLKKQLSNQLFRSPQTVKKTLTTQSKLAAATIGKKTQQQASQKEFMSEAYTSIQKVRSKMKSLSPDFKFEDKLADQELQRKRRGLKTAYTDHEWLQRQKIKAKQQTEQLKTKNQQKKLRAMQLKQVQRQRRSDQEKKALQMKLRDQKCRYLKRINVLIEKLEKNKHLEDRREFKEKLVNENKLTATKLQALEAYHLSQLEALREKDQMDREERRVIQMAHRDIIQRLERELKKESETKMQKIQERFRQEYNSLADMKNVEQQIIQLYKKY